MSLRRRNDEVSHCYEDHKVLFHHSPYELATAVFMHIRPAIEGITGILLVMTRRNRRMFEQYLLSNDLDAEVLEDAGILIQLDADECLEKFMAGGALCEAEFEREMALVLAKSAGAFAHVYGEIVNVLSMRECFDEALQVEQLWNRIAARHRFTLLCGYEFGLLQGEGQSAFVGDACRVHQHVEVPKSDEEDGAYMRRIMREELGDEADRLWQRACRAFSRIPPPYSVMLWLREHAPELACRTSERILKQSLNRSCFDS